MVHSLVDLKESLLKNNKPVVLGFFDETSISSDDDGEGYGMDAWGQFGAAADALRG